MRRGKTRLSRLLFSVFLCALRASAVNRFKMASRGQKKNDKPALKARYSVLLVSFSSAV